MRLLFASVVAVCLIGCGRGGNDATVNVSEDGSVIVDAPGVHIQTGPDGAEVRAPGVSVDAGQGGADVNAPGVNVETGPGGAEVNAPGAKIEVK